MYKPQVVKNNSLDRAYDAMMDAYRERQRHLRRQEQLEERIRQRRVAAVAACIADGQVPTRELLDNIEREERQAYMRNPGLFDDTPSVPSQGPLAQQREEAMREMATLVRQLF